MFTQKEVLPGFMEFTFIHPQEENINNATRSVILKYSVLFAHDAFRSASNIYCYIYNLDYI